MNVSVSVWSGEAVNLCTRMVQHPQQRRVQLRISEWLRNQQVFRGETSAALESHETRLLVKDSGSAVWLAY